MCCRHGSPTDGNGVMAWKEPETRKSGNSGSGTAVDDRRKGWERVGGGIERRAVSRCVVGSKSCSKPSHNTNCVNGGRETHTRPPGLVINNYSTSIENSIEMIADRFVTSQPHGGMPRGHWPCLLHGVHRDVIDGIGVDGAARCPQWCVYNANETHHHKLEFAVTK